jgi:hypothetical protein
VAALRVERAETPGSMQKAIIRSLLNDKGREKLLASPTQPIYDAVL